MTKAVGLSRPKERAPWQPFGSAIDSWRSARREILLSGAAGTGKSRALLEKLHYCADKYKGMRGLIARKTRHSLSQTALVTYEQKVLPEGWLGNYIRFNTTDQQYEYPNGSVIVIGGLDKSSKIMSSEYDMIYVQEATELLEDDWEALTTRLRNHVMPYQQIMADCNPGAPSHWLKKRCDRGATLMLYSKHEDNPSVTDEYLATLDALTGVRKKRLRDGVWAAAEGMVYEDEWDPSMHLIDRFEIPREWPRYWSIDFGFRNPFVWQAWAENPDGELFRYHEIYQTETIVEDIAKRIMQLTTDEPKPQAIVCDHDAEDRATFEKHTACRTVAAQKAVTTGIQTMQGRLRRKANGRPSAFFLRDSLVSIDHALVDKSLPYCTEQEFECYVWNIEDGKMLKEEPVKMYDHGMDCARYLMMHKVQGADDHIRALRERVARQQRRA